LATFTAGFAGFAAFAARDFEACCLAASAPVTITGGRHNAQKTKSDTVVFRRFILVDRSGFAILPRYAARISPYPGLRDEGAILACQTQQCLKKSGGKMTWVDRFTQAGCLDFCR
jgi:hypothetical protein